MRPLILAAAAKGRNEEESRMQVGEVEGKNKRVESRLDAVGERND